jgi:hypothetical protein
MTHTPNHPDPRVQRLLELLADQATGALTPAEQGELDGLLAQGLTDDSGRPIESGDMHEVAGALIAAVEPRDAMPASLRARILASAPGGAQDAAEPPAPIPMTRPSPGATPGWMGWAAAAAAVLLAAIGWLRTPAPTTPPTPEARAQALLADPDTVRIPWASPGDPAGKQATGEVIWNNRLQQGFMRISGLAVNDPSQQQYQLWIIDSGRTDPQPVDGGVFDFAAAPGQERVIPIRPTLPVRKPAAFAVTIEQPGGVVVSKQERVPLLAQPKG